ncbi:MAG TPA: zf-TFIIB domain-containing protein [Pyrinomonadaceae bacterium]
MSNPLDERKRALEEDYFRRQEQELIRKMRERMAAEKQASENAPSLQCPRGDGALVEVDFEEIRIDLCETCGGAWLDASDLESLTRKDTGGWLSRLWRDSSSE